MTGPDGECTRAHLHWAVKSAHEQKSVLLEHSLLFCHMGLEHFDSKVELEKMATHLVGQKLNACRTEPIGRNLRRRTQGRFKNQRDGIMKKSGRWLFVSHFIAPRLRLSSLCRACNACASRDRLVRLLSGQELRDPDCLARAARRTALR